MATDTRIVQRDNGAILEQVVVGGDLSKLSAAERVSYYRQVCESLSINPYTKPFQYITLNSRLTLYATRDCADQLRKRDQISIDKPEVRFEEGLCIVSVTAHTPNGRTDSELGVVPIEGLKGDARANAILKAITKAKRRVTLSIVGLGWLDETEVEAIPDAQPTPVQDVPTQEAAPANPPANRPSPERLERWWKLWKDAKALGLDVESLTIDPNTVTRDELNEKGPTLAALVAAAIAKAGAPKPEPAKLTTGKEAAF